MTDQTIPKWRSHKIVEAAPIMDFSVPELTLSLDTPGGEVDVTVPANFFARGAPDIGDVYMAYPDGYQSWSPRQVFDDGYTLVAEPGVSDQDWDSLQDFDLGIAMQVLRSGKMITRAHWGASRVLVFVPGSVIAVSADRPLGKALPDLVGKRVGYSDHVDMWDSASNTLTPWNPSGDDLTALDYKLVDVIY